jgi:aminopeptidase N
MRICLLIAALFFSPAFLSAAENADYRLPTGISPTSQAIELRLDPSVSDYSGTTTIWLTIDQATDRIGLHQLGLDMTSIVLTSADDARALDVSVGEWDINWLSDGDDIAPGDYELTIEFSGNYSTDSLGMHRVSFEDNDYVFTQMEAMYARRAFPIFDEPSFKIPYQLTVVVPEELVAVANTPVESSTQEEGWRRVTFMQTPPLPSYLLAYAVGPLDRVPIDGLDVPAFIYTPKGRSGEVGFVTRETPTIVKALEDYFGSKYPFRKLDFIAVPEFAFGAMENPGLITYRTDLLLIGDEASGRAAERVLMVIAHEVAHIWYGDLVTMAWWNDLWLNEAFASWMAWTVIEDVYPQFESNLKLTQENAFPSDQRTSAKAIRKPVRTEAETLADVGLNYTKGNALLRMIERYVGKDVWQRAIRAYIKEHAWGNTTERDLWDAASAESGLDVYAIASDFLNQPGFARVIIDENGEVTQQRYLTEGREAPDLAWQIPLNVKYKADDKVKQTFLLLQKDGGTLDIPNDTEWVFPDAGGNGYYRWQTSLEQLYRLVGDIDELTDREKIAVLGNSEALLNAGELSLADYMFVLNTLIREPHPLVFLPALEKLIIIGNDFVDATTRKAFARFVDSALAERFQEVGIDSRPDDNEAIIQMRPRLLRALGQFGSDKAVREAAALLTNEYFESASSVPSGIALEAMRVTALNDDGSRYDQYQKAYLDSTSERQKSNILSAFYFDNPDVVAKHLDFSISPAVPAGDATRGIYAFGGLLEDPMPVYDWLEENLDAFEAKIPAFYHPMLPQIVGDTCSPRGLKLLKGFFDRRQAKYAESLAKAVESAESCIDRRKRHTSDLQQFLKPYREN